MLVHSIWLLANKPMNGASLWCPVFLFYFSSTIQARNTFLMLVNQLAHTSGVGQQASSGLGCTKKGTRRCPFENYQPEATPLSISAPLISSRYGQESVAQLASPGPITLQEFPIALLQAVELPAGPGGSKQRPISSLQRSLSWQLPGSGWKHQIKSNYFTLGSSEFCGLDRTPPV